MNLILRLAWRNIFRNGRRTFLTCLLLACSLIALVLTDGVMRGMMDLMVETTTRTFAGEAQAHKKGFRDSFDVDLYIEDISIVANKLEADVAIEAYTIRTMSGAMMSSADNMAGGLLWGVDGEREAKVSKLKEALVDGSYLTGKDNEILIGEELADLLSVELGDRIVVTLSQVDGGELSQALFRLSGIFKFGMREIDSSMIFINLAQSRKILGMEAGAHQVAFNFVNANDAVDPESATIRSLSTGDIEAASWVDLQPQMSAMLAMVDFSLLIVGGILFLIASLGIINSMFMSIYERIYEFGVAMAIGTRPSQMVTLIMAEAFFLALLSIVGGMIVSYFLIDYFSVAGIPMGDMEFEGISIHNNIKTIFDISQFTVLPLSVVALTLVAAIYPALFTARIVPSEALHKSL
jgi:putative ABC transport system permease protein